MCIFISFKLQKIRVCGDLVRKLKSEKAEKSVVDAEVKVLLVLKDLFKAKSGGQVWPLTQLYSVSFFGKKSLICFSEGKKSMTRHGLPRLRDK